MKILTHPDPLLREVPTTVHVDKIRTDDFRRKCWQMLSLMEESGGIGLAANQVGWDSRVFVMKNRDGLRRIIVNPEWTPSRPEIWTPYEGCLSFPDKIAKIERFYSVRLLYTDITGIIRYEYFSDVDAEIVQHETEHLDGILLIDHDVNFLQRRQNAG